MWFFLLRSFLALIAQNKALPAVLLPESLIPVMTVKPPISIEVKHA